MKQRNEKNDSNTVTLSTTDMEPDTGHATLPAHGIKTLDTPVNIRVISYRRLRHDPDGVSAKAVFDGIVKAGILADDSTQQIQSVTFESRKSKDERTVVEIIPVEDIDSFI